MSFKKVFKVANYYNFKYNNKFKKLATEASDEDYSEFLESAKRRLFDELKRQKKIVQYYVAKIKTLEFELEQAKKIGPFSSNKEWRQKEDEMFNVKTDFNKELRRYNVKKKHALKSSGAMTQDCLDFLKENLEWLKKQSPDITPNEAGIAAMENWFDAIGDAYSFVPDDRDFEHQNTEEDYDKDTVKWEY